MNDSVVSVNTDMQNGAVPGSKAKKTSYHHGDLRSVLLEAAVQLIAERGLQGLSLRECARRAGVSHAAPYRHFPHKRALLSAIAAEGFERLSAAGERAMEGLEDPRARLDAYGRSYVRFAFEHPEHFRLMFASPLADFAQRDGDGGDPGPELTAKPSPLDPCDGRQDDAGAFDLLVAAAVEVAGPGVDPQLAAFSAWSLSHGIAMLVLDGRVPDAFAADADAVDVLAGQVFALWRGALG